ncbi:hypothetical protein V6N13_004291 [Hibiscus sabdariffa]
MEVVPISILVHELGVMREAHLLPVDGIQVKLIIAIDLRRIDPTTGYSIPANSTSPFSSFELAVLTDTDFNGDILLTRALAESASASASEFERNNYGMVAAREASIEEMLKRVEVEAGDETCVICLNELEVGFEASRMPCSHGFHGDCIQKWLRQSHYCPICRFEMPTN